jgi:hypothetical protein
VRPIVAQVERAISSAGGSRHTTSFTTSHPTQPYAADSSEILVRERDGTLREFASISPLSQVLNRQLQVQAIARRARNGGIWRRRCASGQNLISVARSPRRSR